jgi:hypothetical protein
MIQSLEALLQLGISTGSSFAPNSRYYGIATASLKTPGGVTVVYLERRFIPPANSYAVVARHIVKQGERADLIAAQRLGDPLMYWQLCDANVAMRVGDLTAVPGSIVNVTLPAGTPRP